MPALRLSAVLAATVLLSACASNGSVDTAVPEKGNSDYYTVRDAISDEVYISPTAAASADASAARKIYVAPMNTAKAQIFQPPSVRVTDLDAWVMTAAEDEIFQNALHQEFTRALEMQSAYTVVDTLAEADLKLQSTLIALHPYAPKSVTAVEGPAGGTITMSYALVNPSSGEVVIRALDSKSTSDIWAFDEVTSGSEAVHLAFRSWGHQIRRAMLHIQGRSNDPLMQPIQLKPQ